MADTPDREVRCVYRADNGAFLSAPASICRITGDFYIGIDRGDFPSAIGLLQRLGFIVTTAASVRNALDLARTDHFDLLISDLGLPDGSGLDIIRQVKKLYEIRGLRSAVTEPKRIFAGAVPQDSKST